MMNKDLECMVDNIMATKLNKVTNELAMYQEYLVLNGLNEEAKEVQDIISKIISIYCCSDVIING